MYFSYVLDRRDTTVTIENYPSGSQVTGRQFTFCNS